MNTRTCHPHVERLEAREAMSTVTTDPAYWRDILCQLPPAASTDTGGQLGAVTLPAGPASFGQALPQSAAREALQLGTLPTQTDVKTRWPDGSIRFAVVSAAVPVAGVYALAATAPPPAGDALTPDSQSLFVIADARDDVWIAYAYTETADLWLSGPVVSEGRWRLTPQRLSDGAGHPGLQIVVDARTWADGQSRYDVTVENVRDVAGAGAETYVMLAAFGDGSYWYQDWLTHSYLTRWRRTSGPGVLPTVPDLEPVIAAGALPRYDQRIADLVSTPTGPEFAPLREGALNPDMYTHGGRPEIAPFPDWTARYLARGNPAQLPYVLAGGDLAGSWPVHLRGADGSAIITAQSRPDIWMDVTGGWRGGRPAGRVNETGRLGPDVDHQPSLAYVPYLLTGDRFYADEMDYWASYVGMAVPPFNRQGRDIIETNQTRGKAWGLRNITDAAAYLPDSYPEKPYYRQVVTNNFAAIDEYIASWTPPLGSIYEYVQNENWNPAFWDRRWISQWQHNYVAWAIDHANKQGFVGGEGFLLRNAEFQLRLFRDQATRGGAANYLIAVGDQVPPGSGNTIWYTDYRQTYGGQQPLQGLYGVDARLNLLIGRDLNLPGADTALNYVEPILIDEIYQGGLSDLALRAGWFTQR